MRSSSNPSPHNNRQDGRSSAGNAAQSQRFLEANPFTRSVALSQLCDEHRAILIERANFVPEPIEPPAVQPSRLKVVSSFFNRKSASPSLLQRPQPECSQFDTLKTARLTELERRLSQFDIAGVLQAGRTETNELTTLPHIRSSRVEIEDRFDLILSGLRVAALLQELVKRAGSSADLNSPIGIMNAVSALKGQLRSGSLEFVEKVELEPNKASVPLPNQGVTQCAYFRPLEINRVVTFLDLLERSLLREIDSAQPIIATVEVAHSVGQLSKLQADVFATSILKRMGASNLSLSLLGGGKSLVQLEKSLGELIAEGQLRLPDCIPTDRFSRAVSQYIQQASVTDSLVTRLAYEGTPCGSSELIKQALAKFPSVDDAQTRIFQELKAAQIHMSGGGDWHQVIFCVRGPSDITLHNVSEIVKWIGDINRAKLNALRIQNSPELQAARSEGPETAQILEMQATHDRVLAALIIERGMPAEIHGRTAATVRRALQTGRAADVGECATWMGFICDSQGINRINPHVISPCERALALRFLCRHISSSYRDMLVPSFEKLEPISQADALRLVEIALDASLGG